MVEKVDPRSGELTTSNYGWVKPTVGASVDAWGGYINTDLDGIDSTVKSVSTVANAAQTSSQVDAKIAAAAYILPTASTIVLGGVKVDGTTVAISGGGVISAAGAVAVSATAPSSPVVGTLWFDTNGGQMYVWYNDGTSSQWVPVVNQGYAAGAQAPQFVMPPSAASWTHQNWGGTTALTDVTNGVNFFTSSATATITNYLRAVTIAAPAAPYTIDALLSCMMLATSSNSYNKFGLLWYDGTTKAQVISTQVNMAFSTAAGPGFLIENYNPLTTMSGSAVTGMSSMFDWTNVWMRLADNGTNITFSASADGITWGVVYTVAKASGFLGSAGYSNVGFFINEQVMNLNSIMNVVLKSWRVH